MKVITVPIYFPRLAIMSTTQAPPQPVERIYYSPERYGRIENFESSRDYEAYIDQTKYDLFTIAVFLKLSNGVDESINFFCDSLLHYQYLDHDLKKLVYTDLGRCLQGISQMTLSCIPADEDTLRSLLCPIFTELTHGVRVVITNIFYASSSVNSLKKNISWHVDNRRLEIIELVLSQHVLYHHKNSDEAKIERYIDAYKYHFIKFKWLYSYLIKNKNPANYLKKETEYYVIIVLERLNRLLNIVSIIKDIGNMMRQSIEEIINEPTHHEDVEGMRYLSQRGHEAVIKFAQSSNPPIDLNTVLAHNIANNFLFLLKDVDGLYGALAEALAVENNKEILFHIADALIISRIRVRSLEDFFWVDYDGRFRGPLTLEALRLIGAKGALNDRLLRYAIINTPSDLLLSDYHFDWCGNIHGVFNDYLQPKMFALYKIYFMKGKVQASDKDSNGNTFLHAAVFHNDLEAYHHIAHQQYDIINCKNNFGVTALMQAVMQDSIFMVRQLLECKNIDINVLENNGFTASALAVEKQHRDILILLNSHSTTLNHRKEVSKETGNVLTGVNNKGG